MNSVSEPLPPSVLITAFEPFGGSSVNASSLVAQELARRDGRYAVRELPVVAGVAEAAAFAAWDESPHFRWAASLGEASSEPVVRLEWIAVNWDDFRILDNAGNLHDGRKIRQDGPPALVSTFDLPAVAQTLSGQTPLPVIVSTSAGNFLCNRLSFQMLNHGRVAPYAFVHVPCWRPDNGAALFEDLVATVARVFETFDRIARDSEGTLTP